MSSTRSAWSPATMWRRPCGAVLAAALSQACAGTQSSLSPAGPDADDIARLFWWMSAGSLLVWLLVMALSLYAAHPRADAPRERARAHKLVWWGGVVAPTVLLSVLLVYGLRMLPPLLARASRDQGAIYVTGEQWWWRVRYAMPGGDTFELANELRLPRGQRLPVVLHASDVIHSFWVPSLSGKRDMIPGRTTEIALEAQRPGTYLGACAEFCGAAHAQMRFHVVVLEPAAYDAWLARQRSPAAPPESASARAGAAAFQRAGCGACHTVRGTEAHGTLGPDLTHVGGRVGLAAAVLPNTEPAYLRWLTHPKQLKPSVHMPSYAALGSGELHALAAYLKGLR